MTVPQLVYAYRVILDGKTYGGCLRFDPQPGHLFPADPLAGKRVVAFCQEISNRVDEPVAWTVLALVPAEDGSVDEGEFQKVDDEDWEVVVPDGAHEDNGSTRFALLTSVHPDPRARGFSESILHNLFERVVVPG